MDDVIKGESKLLRRARNSEGAGIFVWSSVDTSPRIMIGKDIERSTVSKAMKVSNKCRRVTKKTSFIIYSKNQPFNQYLWNAYYLPAILVHR